MSSSSALLERQLDAAAKEGKIPQAVVFAASRDGNFKYSYAAGKTSVEDGAADIQEDAVFLLASQTKIMTAVAALQAIERGLVSLDDSVEELLPELAQQQVLTGFDENDKPILEARKTTITLRHLFMHTAGTAYDVADPKLIKYQAQRGVQPGVGPDVTSRFTYPLIFQPGEQWCYGPAIDWAGLFIERLTKTTLEDYMKANIWDPLGITTMTFFPTKKGDLEARVPVLSARAPDGKLHPHKAPYINTGVTGCFGGSGAYSALGDYTTFMSSLLRSDGKLLRPESVDELFRPQLSPEMKQSFMQFLRGPMGAFFAGEFLPDQYEHDFALGGAVFVDGYKDGRRKAGTLTWGGVANTFWTIDREAGLALTVGTQIIPPGDVKMKEVISLVEKEIYKMAGVA